LAAQSAHSVTVNFFVLVAEPPEVVMVIAPVFAPAGTVAVTSLSEFALNSVAATPPKLTPVVCERLTPVILTDDHPHGLL
jgi:hypothetical protein